MSPSGEYTLLYEGDDRVGSTSRSDNKQDEALDRNWSGKVRSFAARQTVFYTIALSFSVILLISLSGIAFYRANSYLRLSRSRSWCK